MKLRLVFKRSVFIKEVSYLKEDIQTLDIDIPAGQLKGDMHYIHDPSTGDDINREFLPSLIGAQWLEGGDGKSAAVQDGEIHPPAKGNHHQGGPVGHPACGGNSRISISPIGQGAAPLRQPKRREVPMFEGIVGASLLISAINMWILRNDLKKLKQENREMRNLLDVVMRRLCNK